MKRHWLLSCFLLTGMFLQAQTGTWKIRLHNKSLIHTSQENEKKNSRKISTTDWKRNGYFEILFTETHANTWWRHFVFTDEYDNTVLTRDSTVKVKFSLSTLRKLFSGKKEIRIYTFVSPVDPNMAVRMRRVHLFTLKIP